MSSPDCPTYINDQPCERCVVCVMHSLRIELDDARIEADVQRRRAETAEARLVISEYQRGVQSLPAVCRAEEALRALGVPVKL